MSFSMAGNTEALPLKKIALLLWEPEICWYTVPVLTRSVSIKQKKDKQQEGSGIYTGASRPRAAE